MNDKFVEQLESLIRYENRWLFFRKGKHNGLMLSFARRFKVEQALDIIKFIESQGYKFARFYWMWQNGPLARNDVFVIADTDQGLSGTVGHLTFGQFKQLYDGEVFSSSPRVVSLAPVRNESRREQTLWHN